MAVARNGGRTTPKKPRSEPQVEVGLDPGKLTVGDLIDLEEHFGMSLDQLMSMAKGVKIENMGAKTIAALVFVAKRQVDPEFSPADCRNVSMEEFMQLMGANPDKELKQARQRLAGSRRPAAPAGPTQGG